MGVTGMTRFLAWTGLVVAVAAMLLLVIAGPGYRFGLWELGTGFKLIRWGAYGGMAAGAVAVLALLLHLKSRPPGALWRSVLALVLATAAFGIPWFWLSKARSVPPIHDITTDVADPPQFVDVLPLRADAPNPSKYGGPEVARQQQDAYPGIDTLTFEEAPAAVFNAALSVARDLGWQVVAAKPDQGRIEAVDTTFWFGFKDDVVIRIRASAGGTALDLRSVSRVGTSDVGANAERIHAFSHRLRDRLSG